MMPGGQRIGRRKEYEDIGPQRPRCGIAAMLVSCLPSPVPTFSPPVPTLCAHRLPVAIAGC